MSQSLSESKIAVLVCIAEPFLRAGIRACLLDQPDMDVVDAESVSACADVHVVIADGMAGARMAEEHGLPTFQKLSWNAPVLAITGPAREHVVRSAMEQGIRGFVLTNSPVGDLVDGVRALARGGVYLCPPIAQRLAYIAERDMLTSREGEVLRLLAKGQCNKSIARDLGIAVGTVKVHVKSIMSKLDARCRTEAASIAAERGLVDRLDSSSRRFKSLAHIAGWRDAMLCQSGHA